VHTSATQGSEIFSKCIFDLLVKSKGLDILPTKTWFGFAVGLEKSNGTFWIGLDLVWTRGGDALRALRALRASPVVSVEML
jgi:hypothetical protein